MTHTEESLMKLAYRAVTGQDNATNLRLAIREVLAERNILKIDHTAQCRRATEVEERAERAEAECERLRKDAERLDYIEKHARCDPKMDGHHVWWPTTFKNALRGCTLREAIDAALKDQP